MPRFPTRRGRQRPHDDGGNPGSVTLGGNGESLVNHFAGVGPATPCDAAAG
jgi:hypothetical protein